jgi:hypothetical protein
MTRHEYLRIQADAARHRASEAAQISRLAAARMVELRERSREQMRKVAERIAQGAPNLPIREPGADSA